jgi:hypothetical protein
VTEPRFPTVPAGKGHYESFYLRAVDPGRPRGAWIRCTTHQRPGEPPTGAVWCTVWDAEDGPPVAAKERRESPSVPDGGWIAVGDATFSPVRSTGTLERAAWDLAIAGGDAPLRHLPAGFLYRSPLPRTKLESPWPTATLTGWVEAHGRRLDVAGWSGMVGHNWGAEHAERWIWLHAAVDAVTWLDLAVGRIRVGPLTTPWIANGALSLGGRRRRLRGPARVGARPGACEVAVSGVEIEVRAPLEQTVGWRYADPKGGEHHSLNCSIAELRLRTKQGDELATAHGGAYELGVRETDHGVPVQPFPDP